MASPTAIGLEAFAAARPALPGSGPVAALIAEDRAGIACALAHLAAIGFETRILFAPELPPEAADAATLTVLCRTAEPGADRACLNALIDRVPGRWVHHLYNAEYLFFPFAETRRVGDMLGFVESERRDSVAGVTVDLYPADLDRHPDGIDRDSAHFDAAGYFALGRRAPDGTPIERQYEVHGGLRWRHEQHVPHDRRRIDRIALFLARPKLRFDPALRQSDPELNTFESPWHRSLTACVASFRTARALCALPSARQSIDSFLWRRSQPFAWRAEQLLAAGLMEPGQWF
ncbi:MAG: hypothetical protein JKP97_12875 [Rhodobacteraceae bacterium]|jgi:hypothetical protein|nr:hypothetical protein [Paracoccaceae bacterium]